MPNINGVEILRTGTWNRTKFKREDLERMAANVPNQDFEIPLKLGHVRDPGAPAYGWVRNVRVVGEKLLADFVDIPSKLFEMIRQKMFNNVSVEIIGSMERNGKKLQDVLSAVALLGADIPAVAGLKPLKDTIDKLDGIVGEFSLEVGLDSDLLAFMATNGQDSVGFDIDILAEIAEDCAEDARKFGYQSVTFRLEDIPPQVVSGLLEKFSLRNGDKSEILAKCQEAAKHPSISVENPENFERVLFKHSTGAFPEPEKQEKKMDQLVKLISLALATAAGNDSGKLATLKNSVAQAAGIDEKSFSELLDGKTLELSDAQVSGLGKALATLNSSTDDAVTRLQQQLQEANARADAAEADKHTITKLQQDLQSLQQKQRDSETEARVQKVKIPALRPYFRSLFELADKADKGNVRFFAIDDANPKGAFKDRNAVEVIEELAEQVNKKLNGLFSEESETTDFELEDAAPGANAGDELDRLTKDYMAKNSGTAYSQAFAIVCDQNPELKKAYAAEVN